MVVERLFKERWIERRPIYSFFLGVIFTLFAFFTARLLFQGPRTIHMVGITTILFAIIIALPGVNKLFDIEERREAKGKQSFLKEHEEVFDFFLYFFLGAFIVFFIISFITPQHVMSEKLLFTNVESSKPIVQRIEFQTINNSEGTDLALPPPPDFGDNKNIIKFELFNKEVTSIFVNNSYIVLLCFLLSLLYGSGALFLIIFNASIWASTFASVMQTKIPEFVYSSVTYIICNIGILSIHMFPEMGAYIIAAIAGGVLSKAVTKEKFWSIGFKRVLFDSLILFFISIFVLLVAALLEVHISKRLYRDDVCIEHSIFYVVEAVLIVIAFIWFEWYRNKHHRRKKK